MSDYSGPSERVLVRFTREWHGTPAGTVTAATWYPALGTYYVPAICQHIGSHPAHKGLLVPVPPTEDR